MNIYIDIDTMADGAGKPVIYKPSVHWCLDDRDYPIQKEKVEGLKNNIQRLVDAFFGEVNANINNANINIDNINIDKQGERM